MQRFRNKGFYGNNGTSTKNFRRERETMDMYIYMYINTEPFSSKEDCRSAMIHRMQGQWLTLGRAHSSQREILSLALVMWNFYGLSERAELFRVCKLNGTKILDKYIDILSTSFTYLALLHTYITNNKIQYFMRHAKNKIYIARQR